MKYHGTSNINKNFFSSMGQKKLLKGEIWNRKIQTYFKFSIYPFVNSNLLNNFLQIFSDRYKRIIHLNDSSKYNFTYFWSSHLAYNILFLNTFFSSSIEYSAFKISWSLFVQLIFLEGTKKWVFWRTPRLLWKMIK